MGKLRAASFNPDVPSVLMLGGEREDLIHVFDTTRIPQCASAFPNLKPTADIENLDNQDDVEMDEN